MQANTLKKKQRKTRSNDKTNTNNFVTKKCTKKLATVICQEKIQKRTKHEENLPQTQLNIFTAEAQQKAQQKQQ